MNIKINIATYNLFYLFVCILWRPLQVYFLKIDGSALTILFLTIIAFILNLHAIFRGKGSLQSPIFKCWLVLVLYSFTNSMIKGFEAPSGTMMYLRANFITPFVFLLIAIISIDTDRIKCLKVLSLALVIYLVLGVLHFKEDADRMLAEGLGNHLPLLSTATVFVTGILFCEDELKGGWVTFFIVVVLASFTTVTSATRKAFGALVLVIVGVLLEKNHKLTPRTIILTIIAFVAIYIGFDWVMSNTFMGERLLEDKEFNYTLSSNVRVNGFLTKVLGDRTFFYYVGIQIFKQHPITGIGLTNFMPVAETNIRIHSEYIVQLCENGIIGFGLLVLFYGLILKRLSIRRKEGKSHLVYLFGLLAILFLDITTWTYNMDYAMLVYAILINYTFSSSSYEISDTPPQGQLQ